MATLAQTIWKHSSLREERQGSGTRSVRVPDSEPGTQEDPFRLRPLPNEDLYLFVKRFDNTGVVRATDPRAGRVAWKAIGGACVAATLLVGMLLPGAYRLLAGYQLDRLKQTREQATRELRTLEFEEERLRRMERMQELAESRQFAPPTRDQVQHVQPKDSVAKLQEPR